MAISFELRLEYGKYAYHWNRQTVLSEKWQKKLICFNFKTLIIPSNDINIVDTFASICTPSLRQLFFVVVVVAVANSYFTSKDSHYSASL